MNDNQKQWYLDLQDPLFREEWSEVAKICSKIAEDDAGTDKLTRLLARIIMSWK